MLFEYAVEPTALARWNPLWQALDQFGIAHGRLISQFPKKWQRLVYEATDKCPPMERKTLEVRLEQLKTKLLSSRRAYDAGRSWRENASAQMASSPFHAIIQSDNPANVAFILTEVDLHAGNPRWNVSTQRSVERRPSEMSACIAVLCRLSRELVFVDPHFSTDRRFTEVLQEFIRVAHLDGQRFQRIEFHTGTKIPKAILEQECARWVAPRIPSGIALRFCLWSERVGGEKLHARYVLTERGGIRFDVGLDSGDAGQTTDISLLTDGLHERRWADFQAQSAAYDLADEFTIIGV